MNYDVVHGSDITSGRRNHLFVMGLRAGLQKGRDLAVNRLSCSESFRQYYRKSVEYAWGKLFIENTT